MNENKLFYDIAGMHLCIASDGPLTEEPKWQQFRRLSAESAQNGSNGVPDYTYRIHWAEDLPKQIGQPLQETETVCRYPDNIRYYRLRKTAPFHAAAKTGEREMSITVLKQNAPWGQNAQQLFDLLSLPWLLLKKDRLIIHGAYIETEGRGIIFSAPSGTGKSTQALLWKRYKNAEIINGDRVAIGMENGKLYAWSMPVSGTSEDCIAKTLPVQAIVFLSQAKENTARKMTDEEAFAALAKNAYFAPTYSEGLPRHYSTILSVSETKKLWHMACLPDESAVKALSSALNHSQK